MSSGFKPFAMEAKPPDGLVLSEGQAEHWAFTAGGGGGVVITSITSIYQGKMDQAAVGAKL